MIPLDAARSYARQAGALYLVIIACGLFGEIGVRLRLVSPGDPAATAASILASEGLYRFGLAAETLMALADVALAVLLFWLLRSVNWVVALTAAAFRLVQTAVIAASLLAHHAALLALQDSELADREALALFAIDLQSHGYDLGLIFFGANSLLTGWLVINSGFLPRLLGALLIAAGAVYLVGSYLRFLAPTLSETFAPAYVVPIVAETAFCLWLLLVGVNEGRWRSALRRDAGRV